METTSVLVVEDEPEFLRTYCDAISREPDFRLVGQVATLAAAMALARQAIPDVLVVDLGLPDGDGTELIRFAAARRPDCDALVVTIFGDDAHVIRAIEAGATGYLLKDSPPSELVRCIRELRAGGSPINPGIARRLLTRMRAIRLRRASPRGWDRGACCSPASPRRPATKRFSSIARRC